MLVIKIGTKRASMLEAMATSTFLFFLISRKNLVITWTPSELAIVNNMIGIVVFSIANKNLSDPVNLYAHPMNPNIANNEQIITNSTIPTAGILLRLISKIVIINIKPVLTNNWTSLRIIPGIEPVKYAVPPK